jgi:hypothetical protein
MLFPLKLLSASSTPIGIPIAAANANAVKVTRSDRKIIPYSSGSKEINIFIASLKVAPIIEIVSPPYKKATRKGSSQYFVKIRCFSFSNTEGKAISRHTICSYLLRPVLRGLPFRSTSSEKYVIISFIVTI